MKEIIEKTYIKAREFIDQIGLKYSSEDMNQLISDKIKEGPVFMSMAGLMRYGSIDPKDITNDESLKFNTLKGELNMLSATLCTYLVMESEEVVGSKMWNYLNPDYTEKILVEYPELGDIECTTVEFNFMYITLLETYREMCSELNKIREERNSVTVTHFNHEKKLGRKQIKQTAILNLEEKAKLFKLLSLAKGIEEISNTKIADILHCVTGQSADYARKYMSFPGEDQCMRLKDVLNSALTYLENDKKESWNTKK